MRLLIEANVSRIRPLIEYPDPRGMDASEVDAFTDMAGRGEWYGMEMPQVPSICKRGNGPAF